MHKRRPLEFVMTHQRTVGAIYLASKGRAGARNAAKKAARALRFASCYLGALAPLALITNVSAQPTPILVSPTQLTFSAVTGGDAPSPQELAIYSANGTPASFSAQVLQNPGTQSSPTWLTVSPPTGIAPGRVVVTVNQAELAASPAPATIQITASGNVAAGPPSPILVSVSLTLTNAKPQLQVIPAYLRFAARSQAPETLEQAIAVGNSGGGSIGFTASVQSKSSWITSVTPGGGQTLPNVPVVLRVDIDTKGLTLGSHHDTILINSTSGLVQIPVSVFISDQGPIISVNLTGVRFLARQGAGSAVPRTVSVLNVGDPTSTIHWTAGLLSGTDWLTLSSTTGTATTTVPGSVVLSVAPSISGFATGARYALLQIYDPTALNSPQYVVAVLDVEPDSTPVVPELLPAGVFFLSTGGALPAAQTALVYASSTPVAFQVATTTTDGANWLTATETTTSASATLPGKISISANPSNLIPGVYTGGVNVSIASVLQTVNVTLVVPLSFQPTITSPAIARARAVPGCTPGRLVATETSLTDNFAVPAGWPATLTIQLNDDCGNAVTNGSAVASFPNGDPPLSLTSDLLTGAYSATWQPGAVMSVMTVTVLATAPSLPSSSVQFIGTVNANTATTPSLVPNGVLDVFFDAPTAAAVGGALAPGSIVQVQGTGLAPVAASTETVPLASQLNGTALLVGGLLVPLYYVSPDLLYAQIPFELVPNRQYQLLVITDAIYTPPQTIDVVPYQPGVASFGDGSAIAQHRDSTLVTATSPAKPGENVVIFLAGMGATNPPVPSGTRTPLQAVLDVVQPTVTVGGQNAPVSPAGLAPTEVGLYQIIFTVPLNSPAGNLNLVITQNGTASNTTTLPVTAP